jgi:hypothetical protein
VYQARKPAPTALAAALLFAATAATAPAAPPIKLQSADESRETRFVLFALEELFRTTWPCPTDQEREKREERNKEREKHGERKEDPWGVGDGHAVRTFIAQRERIVDDLSHRVRDAKLGGDHNTDLIEALELYMKAVREHGEWYAAELDKVIDIEGTRKQWLEIHRRIDRGADPARYAVAAQVNAAALDYMQRPDADPLGGMFTTLFVGMVAEWGIRFEVQARACDEFSRGPLKLAREEYAKKQPALAQALIEKVQSDLTGRRRTAGELAAALGGPRKWAANDTPFAEENAGERTADPFILLHRIDAEEVTKDRGPTREAADHLAKAKGYLKLIGMVPRPAVNAYNFYRAVIYTQAGREANRAAALSVGANGFSSRKGSEASRLAIDVWAKYVANSDRDVTPEVLYNYALALVYNAAAVKAYDTLKKASAQFLPRSPDFYYDVARLCSVAAEDVAIEFAKLPPAAQKRIERQTQQRVNQMLQDSSLTLQRGVCCGFKDVERARETPDLKQLRGADARTLGSRRTFDQIVADQKTFEKVIENFITGK